MVFFRKEIELREVTVENEMEFYYTLYQQLRVLFVIGNR